MSIETPLKAIRVEVGLVKNYHEQDHFIFQLVFCFYLKFLTEKIN